MGMGRMSGGEQKGAPEGPQPGSRALSHLMESTSCTKMVHQEGLEPSTYRLEGGCSIH